jgi:hypothetical protein
VRHIKLENNIPIDYTLEQLSIDVPDAVIYVNMNQMPHPNLLANYNVYPLITTPHPSINEDETVEEGIPEFKDGEWQQTWVIRKLSAIEIEEIVNARTDEFQINPALENSTESSFLTDGQTQEARYDICKGCAEFTALKTCKECGCIMPLKIKLRSASCPLDKW